MAETPADVARAWREAKAAHRKHWADYKAGRAGKCDCRPVFDDLRLRQWQAHERAGDPYIAVAF